MDLIELQHSLETLPKEYAISLDESTSEDAKKLFDEKAQQQQQPLSITQWLSRPSIEQGPLVSDNPKETFIADLSSRVNFVWTNHILYLQTIRPAFVEGAAAWTLVQDSKGDVVAMSLWNYLPIKANGKLHFDAIADEIPTGTYLAIRQPLLVPNSVWSRSTSIPMLRVDNPTCLQIFEERQDWESTKAGGPSSSPTILMNIDELKQAADEAFQKQAYQSACRKYQRILQALDKENNADQLELKIHCRTNLADSFLQLGRYEQAEQCARVIQDTNTKAQEILAQALFHMGQPNQAKDLLLDLRNKVKDDPKQAKTIQSLLGDCLQAIMEEKMGNYNIRKMMVEASLFTELPFHADYQSPKVSLGVPITRPSDGMEYRGVMATDDIKEGDLLTSTRAFAFCHSPRIDSNFKAAAQKKDLYEVRQVHQAVQHLMNRPSLASSFYHLEAAGEILDQQEETVESKYPVIDLAKIRGILESNRFGVDVKHPSSPMELKPPSEEAEGDPVGVGLWLATSMFNHSCTPNAAWTPIGNQMMVYASKDIPKGTEVCISYVHVASSYQERKERFLKWSGGNGFACGCEWCHLLRSNDELCAMNEEVQKAFRRMTASNEQFDSINEVLSKSRRKRISKAFAKVTKRFRHSLYTIHMMEALQHADDGYRESARDSVEAAVELGYEIRGGLRQETRTQDLCCLIAVYMTCNQDDKAKSVLETLCQYQMVLPNKFEDFQTFVMMSSMTFWGPYQNEPFMKRWALLNQQVWEARSKALK
mmetsp:Transcript_12280/g.29234  ORF Transcript_12280/g.29234 Transcript_12280/m.29234 type:complete len:764 (-) Transcript_12280:804-3095(-)